MENGTSISIPNGSDILVREFHLNANEKLPLRNNLFVLVTTTGTILKQIIEHDSENGFFMCRSYNEKYKDFKVDIADVLQTSSIKFDLLKLKILNWKCFK